MPLLVLFENLVHGWSSAPEHPGRRPQVVTTVKQSTHVAQLERFCNDVASEFLLTMASLPDIVRISTFDVTVKAIRDIATCRKLSGAVTAQQFGRSHRIDRETYPAIGEDVCSSLERRQRVML